MAMATHSRPTYTDRSRLWGVGIADLEDPPPSHFTLHSWNRRCQSSAVSRQQSGQTSDVRPQHISEMLAMRYPTARSARDGGTGGKYWNRSGKVQEHGGWGSAAAGQAQLTPADSAILASQPLKRLVLTPSLFRRLSLLAAGLDREVVLCLQGSVSGDTAVVRDFVMPDLLRSTADLVEPQPCLPTTLAVWHNHPWTGPDSSFGVKTPEDLCSLSQPDLRTVVADSIPFAVVSVGRTPRPIVCWWRRVQAVVNRHVKFLPRFPRQWAEMPSWASLADPPAPPASVP